MAKRRIASAFASAGDGVEANVAGFDTDLGALELALALVAPGAKAGARAADAVIDLPLALIVSGVRCVGWGPLAFHYPCPCPFGCADEFRGDDLTLARPAGGVLISRRSSLLGPESARERFHPAS